MSDSHSMRLTASHGIVFLYGILPNAIINKICFYVSFLTDAYHICFPLGKRCTHLSGLIFFSEFVIKDSVCQNKRGLRVSVVLLPVGGNPPFLLHVGGKQKNGGPKNVTDKTKTWLFFFWHLRLLRRQIFTWGGNSPLSIVLPMGDSPCYPFMYGGDSHP